MPFAKGSQAAKDHMAKLRSMKGGSLGKKVAAAKKRSVKKGGIVASRDRQGNIIPSPGMTAAQLKRLFNKQRKPTKPKGPLASSPEGQAMQQAFLDKIKLPAHKGQRIGGPQSVGGRFELPSLRVPFLDAQGRLKIPSKAPPLKVPGKTKPKRRPKPRPRNPLKPVGPFSDRGRESEFPEAPVDHVTDSRVKKRKLVKVKLPLHKGAALGPVRRKPKGPKGVRPRKIPQRLKAIHGPPAPMTRGPVRGLHL